MKRMTAMPDYLTVPPNGFDAGPPEGGRPLTRTQTQDDPLGDVLASVRLTGALFFVVEATSPWCIEVPHTKHYAATVLPQAQHLISYHIIVEGSGLASVPGVDPIAYDTGDILIFPHGDGYRMQNAVDTPPELDFDQTLAFMQSLANGSLPFVVAEGGGGPPPATTICGFLGCDSHPFNPVLAGLPRMLRLRRPRNGDMLDSLIGLTMNEARSGKPGGRSVRLRLSELMFIELLRRYIDTPGPKPAGWLAAMRNPSVAAALAALHSRPQDDWSVDALARYVGISRSTLAQRFVEAVGEPPLRYLTRWRMQVAATLLEEGALPVSEIARQVGYEAEAAFSRRFKSTTGRTPSEWRAASRPAR